MDVKSESGRGPPRPGGRTYYEWIREALCREAAGCTPGAGLAAWRKTKFAGVRNYGENGP